MKTHVILKEENSMTEEFLKAGALLVTETY